MNYVLKKCADVDSNVRENTILLKRNIKLKMNLMKKQVRFISEKEGEKMNYLFIQSNSIPVLYGISEYCGIKFIDFPAQGGDIVQCMDSIQTNIIEKYTDIFKGLVFSNNIQRNSVRFRYTGETRVFIGDDQFKGKLTSGTLVKIIVCPREVWITNEKFGFNWDIIQVQVVEMGDIRVEKNLFVDEYGKYIKMMKTGVPEGAIKLKMELDGVDSNVDLKKISKGLSSGIPPPPPPPPGIIGGSGSGGGGGGGMASVFADIKNGGGVKLKKVTQTVNKKKIKEKTGLGGKISLTDILKARGKLNKTGSTW